MAITKEDEILIELQRISKILVLSATKAQSQKDQISMLSRVGYEPKEIADLLGTTANTVSVALTGMKKIKSAKNKVTKN